MHDLWSAEGLSGIYQNELTALVVYRAAAAFAACLREQTQGIREPAPKILVAGDGRPLTMELLSAAAEAVCWCGCDVLEAGEAASDDVSVAVRRFRAQGGLLVGNVLSEARTASVSFYGENGMPWSISGRLESVKVAFDRAAPRPVRNAGKVQRLPIDEARGKDLKTLKLLRPLRIVLDSACGPLRTRLSKFLPVDCQLIQPQPLPSQAAAGKPRSSKATFREQREKMISRQVVADGADFGIWIDGLGEACTVVDDRGLVVASDTLVSILARCPLDEMDASSEFAGRVDREGLWQRNLNGQTAISGNDQGHVLFRDEMGEPRLTGLLAFQRLISLLNLTGEPLRKLLGSRR